VSALLVFVVVAMVATTAVIVARILALPALAAFVLCAYLAAFAEVVCLVLILSAFELLRASVLIACVTGVFFVAIAAWYLLPSTPRTRFSLAAARELGREPPLGALVAIAAAALTYSAALILFTPPKDWDALTYHLSRSAFWLQAHGVGYVPGSDVIRINANPPNAEVGSLVTMLLSGGDRYVGFTQFAALLATSVGVFGVARRVGLRLREAAFGALLFLSLPVVVLQGSAALNDLVVASFLVSASYFLLGSTRVELALGGLAVALAAGTKFTAYIALPLLLLVVLAGQARRRWIGATVAILAGACIGSYWLVVNLVQTGRLDAGAGDELDQLPERTLSAVLARASRMLANVVDDMNLGPDLRLYAIVGALLGIAVALKGSGRRAWASGLAIAAIGLVPLTLPRAHELAVRVHEELWISLGTPDLAHLDPNRESWSPSTVYSYYGPSGLILGLLGVAIALVNWTRRGSGYAVLLAVAPLILLLLVAFALVYDPWRARFLAYGFALAAAAWGLLLRHRWAAWSATSLAAVTVLLAFVHSIEKPAGITIFDPSTRASVWGESRETVQTWLRHDDTEEIVRYFAAQPLTGRVGVELEEDDWVYPYFGRTLERQVTFSDLATEDDGLDWLVTKRSAAQPTGWSVALRTKNGWRVLRRVSN
jgi:hypothetical protein